MLAALLAPQVLSAAAITGTIQDARNAPLDGVTITVWNPSSKKGLRSTAVSGNYTISGLEGGNYLLKAEKDGFALLLGAVQIRADASHELNLMLEDNSGNASLVKALPRVRPVVKAPDPGPTPKRIQGAKLIHKAAASYPNSAKQAGISGTVDIATVMRVDGTLDDLVVLSAPSPDLALAALFAVMEWRYSPTLVDGRAAEVEFTIQVNFRL